MKVVGDDYRESEATLAQMEVLTGVPTLADMLSIATAEEGPFGATPCSDSWRQTAALVSRLELLSELLVMVIEELRRQRGDL